MKTALTGREPDVFEEYSAILWQMYTEVISPSPSPKMPHNQGSVKENTYIFQEHMVIGF